MDAGAGAGAAREADDKKAGVKKRWAGKEEAEDGPSPAAPREEDGAGKEAALAECAVSCCLFCACLPVALLCCVARAPARAARRCWRLGRRRRPARRLAPGGSSSFSDAELGDLRQGRRRAMADEDDDGRSRAAPPPAPPQQPPPRDRRRS